MKIPSTTEWTQLNNGNIRGILRETHNISLDKRGQIQLGRKALALVDSQITDFSDVMAIVYFDGNYFIVTDSKVFEGDLGGAAFTAVTSSPTLGSVSDGVVCYSRLYVSDTTALAYHTGSAWTTGIGSLTATYPHPLCVFDALTTYKLAVGDGNLVKTYDSSGNANSVVLTLPENYIVTSMAYSNGYLHVATKEINGGEAAIFMWNGSGTNAQYKIDAGAAWVYSITPYRGFIVAVTNEGEIFAISGTSVQQLAVFPVYNEVGVQWDLGNATRGKIYNRGMVAHGDVLYININGEIDGSAHVEGMKSGVWCYDPQIGLYHYASSSTDLYVKDNSFTVTSNVITTSATHGLKLGDVVTFSAISGISGVTSNVKYYAIPVATNTLKIAATRSDAFDGNNITISGTASTDMLWYAPNTDFGQKSGSESGAIVVLNYLDNPNKLFSSHIMWGSALTNNASTERSVLCVLSDRYNEGSFTIQRQYTENVSQNWKDAYSFIDGIQYSNELSIVKVLKEPRKGLPTRSFSGTWLNATTINTTDFTARNLVQQGDEIEFLSGNGQGRIATVIEVNNSASVTSIVVDESYGTAGQSSSIKVNPYKEAGRITYTREFTGYAKTHIGTKSNWVELKYALRGFEPSVAMIELTNGVNKTAQ